MYADKITDSMQYAIDEVTRRRKIQLEFNEKHGITPKTIQKPIRVRMIEKQAEVEEKTARQLLGVKKDYLDGLTPKDMVDYKKKVQSSMKQAARDLNFELAAKLRDFLKTLE